MKKIWFGLLSSLLVMLSFNSAVFAEEVVVEAPAAEPAYTPPPEALQGVGGWAVVDPNTGTVHGVIVCSNDVCGPSGSWGGKMPVDYMGCSGCDLRFQTRATDDGNVAGWHGSDVKWNEKEKNFTLSNKSVDANGSQIETKQKLIPEKTASDGKNLHTGLVDIKTSFKSEVEGEAVAVNTQQDTLNSDEAIVEVSFDNWRKYEYGAVSDLKKLTSDVETDLVADGYLTASEEEVVEEEVPVFVKAIRELTKRVVEFFTGWF